MMRDTVKLDIGVGEQRRRIEARRAVFSPAALFRFDRSADDKKWLSLLASYLSKQPGLVFLGSGPLLGALLRVRPKLARIPKVASQPLDWPVGSATVFLIPVDALSRMRLRQRLPADMEVIDAGVLADIAGDDLPARAWMPVCRNIYPVHLPDIEFEPGLDFLLLDCPARNLALMPNGLAYVSNALKKAAVRFQTFDLDIVTYHRFHIHRLFDAGGRIKLASGRMLPVDPWQAEHYDLWQAEDVIDHFMPIIEEAAAAIVKAAPRMIGLSIHQCNEEFSRALVAKVRQALPDLIVIVGGYSCYNPEIGRSAFPECDYMIIGEADLTIGPLVEALAKGETPTGLPGVLCRDPQPQSVFIPGPMPHNLDRIEFPRYEWFDISLYRNFDGYQLTPIIASRGCRWSRCTFCAERFFWRVREAKAFVDELEWLSSRGCSLFMFNESDLNGMPEKLVEICEEIIRRDLHVKLTGQLRIHKRSDRSFFDTLRRAGFVSLRFGVDAFSANTMRLQMKGYTPDIVHQNLKDCWQAGIYTEVNWVIGVPGETWDDVNEGIQFIMENRSYIGRLANVNPLIFVNGSVYWTNPDAYNIRFRKPRDQLYKDYWRALPADQWYSEYPYIDHDVRKHYFEHIVLTLADAGFPMGNWARRIIGDVRAARDRHRAGGFKEGAVAPLVQTEEEAAEVDGGINGRPAIIPFDGYWYVYDPSQLAGLPVVADPPRETATTRLDRMLNGTLGKVLSAYRSPPPAAASPIQVLGVVTVGAEADLIRTIGSFNIVAFDGAYYGVPHGVPVDWAAGDATAIPGIVRGTALSDVVREVKEILATPPHRAGAQDQPPADEQPEAQEMG